MITEIVIQNIHCDGCKMLLERTCAEIDGVEKCEVDQVSGKTNVYFSDGEDVSGKNASALAVLIQKIDSIGRYKVA